jgi:hypothetical protein
VDWADSVGLTIEDLKRGDNIEALAALSHWCWYVCDRAPLPVAIAAPITLLKA